MFSDIEMAESAVEEALQNLREYGDDESSRVHMRNRWRKTIRNELHFLREQAPSSHILHLDMSDITLELE